MPAEGCVPRGGCCGAAADACGSWTQTRGAAAELSALHWKNASESALKFQLGLMAPFPVITKSTFWASLVRLCPSHGPEMATLIPRSSRQSLVAPHSWVLDKAIFASVHPCLCVNGIIDFIRADSLPSPLFGSIW
ncbi:hypothetical protein TREES_T100015068 [Tupaia chinensis]|uniref:Uncharacterized protein n=1 Tax=Tupaia chinensis TaxID=246437 RepID=L9KJH3_TUPCH|nr:hypothetical protein TREES_T100015068 [Tupaia chinensis]